MKLTIERDALLRALNAAAAVVERRATIPILANVLVEAAGDAIAVVASDLEIQIGMSVPAQVESAGATTVGAQLLTGIVRELDEGAQVELELDGVLHLRCGRSRYKLPAIAADEFPRMAALEGATAFALPCDELRAMLKSIAHAMSDEETRFYLMGVHIDVHDGELALAATNTQVLAVARTSVPDGAAPLDGNGIILHRKLISELLKLLDGADGDIALATDHQRVSLTLGTVAILAKLIDGQFPDWRRAVPQDQPHELKLRSSALAGAVRRSVAISDAKVRSVRVDLAAGLLKMSVRSNLNGDAAEEVPAAYDGPELTFGWQSRYVLDTLDAIGGDEVIVGLSDPRAPTLFNSPARPDGLWLVMPMTV